MDNTNALRKYLKSKIESITGWDFYFISAIDTNLLPYGTYDLVELNYEEGKYVFELTVEWWDKDTPFDCITSADRLDAAFKKHKELTELFLIQIFLGSPRQFIEDEDKTIKRLQRKYDMIIHERSE